MKPSTAIILVICAVGFLSGIIGLWDDRNSPPLSETAWLRACAQVESGGKLDAVNHGASDDYWGEYQISTDIMRQWLKATGYKEWPNVIDEKMQTAAATWWLGQLERKNQTFNARRLFELWRGKDDEDYEDRAMAIYQEYDQ